MLRSLFATLAVLSLTGLVAPELMAQGRATPRRSPPSQRSDGPPPPRPAAATRPARGENAAPVIPEEVAGISLDRVVAIVNDGVVTQSELDDQLALVSDRLRRAQQPPPPPEVLRTQVLDRLVLQELQLQRAERMGIKVTDEMLNQTIAGIAQENRLTLAQLPAALAQQGVDYGAYRDNVRKEIQLSLVRQREVLSQINVTPRELEQFMERLKKLPNEQDEYDVSHILIEIPTGATQAQVDEARKKAQEVHDRAAGGEDFSRLAIAFSNAQTALEGGALGWRPGPELPTSLAETIVALKPGQVSQPLELANGFHIVKLNGLRSAAGDPVQDQVRVRHILVKTNTLQDDATVSLKLAGVRTRILNGEDFAVFASSMSEDTESAVNGGEMDWTSPEAFVPEFSSQLVPLKDGEISPPFQTEYGWHIVQMLGRRKFDTTEDNLRERAFRQLRDARAEEETELWLRRMRDEAFVDTNL